MTKVAIVTGANKGIGYGIVKKLCEQFEGTVFLTARDEERGNAAVDKLVEAGLKPVFHQLDVDSEESITTFVSYIKDNFEGIDVLVNNAAIAFKQDKDAFGDLAERTINTNYYGVVRMCEAIFPLLKPHARVVNVSSSAGVLHRIPDENIRKRFLDPDLNLDALNDLVQEFIEAAKAGDYKDKGWPMSGYIVSKVALTALTMIQQKALLDDDREGIIVNAVHPGYVTTDLTGNKGSLSVEQGAVAPVYCALLPEGSTAPKGKLVWSDKKVADWTKGK